MDKKKWFHRPKKKHTMPGERERRRKLLHLPRRVAVAADDQYVQGRIGADLLKGP